jgi:hypothetical protein
MARKPKKYRPHVEAPKAPPEAGPTKAAERSPMPEPRTKRVREPKISAKERSIAAKKAARAAWLKKTA